MKDKEKSKERERVRSGYWRIYDMASNTKERERESSQLLRVSMNFIKIICGGESGEFEMNKKGFQFSVVIGWRKVQQEWLMVVEVEKHMKDKEKENKKFKKKKKEKRREEEKKKFQLSHCDDSQKRKR
jgi:phosphoserine aminotransferase